MNVCILTWATASDEELSPEAVQLLNLYVKIIFQDAGRGFGIFLHSGEMWDICDNFLGGDIMVSGECLQEEFEKIEGETEFWVTRLEPGKYLPPRKEDNVSDPK